MAEIWNYETIKELLYAPGLGHYFTYGLLAARKINSVWEPIEFIHDVTTDYLLGLSDMKRDLSGQIKMNETLDEYYDLIEVYRRMDGYDREMVWSIMQTVGKTAEKRKRGVGNDKSSDL